MKLTRAIGGKSQAQKESARILIVARCIPTLIVAALLAMGTIRSADAQLYTGSVSGVISDQSGAASPRVTAILPQFAHSELRPGRVVTGAQQAE
jgi:hypothetical protein